MLQLLWRLRFRPSVVCSWVALILLLLIVYTPGRGYAFAPSLTNSNHRHPRMWLLRNSLRRHTGRSSTRAQELLGASHSLDTNFGFGFGSSSSSSSGGGGGIRRRQSTLPLHFAPANKVNSFFDGKHTRNCVRSFSSAVAPQLATVVEDETRDVNLHQNDTISQRQDSVREQQEFEKTNLESSSDTSLETVEIQSQPKEGGNWDPEHPIDWAENFGRRSPEKNKYLETVTKLKPGDEGYFDVSEIKHPKASIVRTREQARQVLEVLMNADESIFHACDTEVMEIDLKELGPVGNGYVSCVSIYSGPDFDYGLGDGPGTTLWIDNLDDSHGVLQEFKEWFEDPRFLKVWHNYGFDRHVMWNEGIDCLGFGGDTMHMARLQDTSRMKAGLGYSLEALTGELLSTRKKPMKEIFGVPRIKKDGTPGSIVDIPPVEVMQRDPRFRKNFIEYSCYDAEGTWLLHAKLSKLLRKMSWLSSGENLYDYYMMHMREFGHVLTDMERRGIRVNARDYLASVEKQARKDREEHSRIFREWAASKIGPDGLVMNPASSTQLGTFLFGGALNKKTGLKSEKIRVFKMAREEVPTDILAEFERMEDAKRKDLEASEPPTDQLETMKAVQLKQLCKEYGLKVSGKKAELQDRLREHLLTVPAQEESDEFDSLSDEDLKMTLTGRGLHAAGSRDEMLATLREDIKFARELQNAVPPDEAHGYRTIGEALEAAAKRGGATEEILTEIKAQSEKKSKYIEVTVESLGMKPLKETTGGAPSCTADVLRKLAGDPFEDPPKYGKAFDFFGGGDEGHEACVALYSLCSIGSIDTMIANFLTSLQLMADHDSRVHCSLNLNTETGRLSSRRPNLQNQPALEKDKYKIRKAFEASPGNSLIVADYGQLELRLLASMTKCESMIRAFKAGGDFHSRTALDMFDHIQEKVDAGEVLLEWDYADGDPPKPLLKDAYGSERRKAKTLNFSIAYGKTAHGLSQDWGVTTEEAQEMLQKWYDSRPEVEIWQKQTKAYANKYGITRTLMGRYRQIPDAKSRNQKFRGHAERASINTPIQGGAADVAMMAMNKINANEKIRKLGWILLLQIHDEVILEGPEETAKEAFEEVIKCMESPWVQGLYKTIVPLLVDGSYEHKTWYDAK